MEIVKRTLCMILTAALLACFPSAEAAEPESREDYQLRIPTEENLSENERRLDDMLTRMKQEADQLYPSTVPYAIIDWEDRLGVHPSTVSRAVKMVTLFSTAHCLISWPSEIPPEPLTSRVLIT